MLSAINILIAIIVFGLLVVVHEFGHFIAAKKCGVVVKEFSVGMGPRFFSVTKGGTKYSLKAVPFGGSCAMLGEDEDTVVEGSFNSRPVWQRMIIVFAGPFFNFILAGVAALIMVNIVGTGAAYITEIDENTSAYEQGLRNDDHLISMNGHSIETIEEIQYGAIFYPLEKQQCTVKYERDGQINTITFDAVPEKSYKMGFNFNGGSEESAKIGKVNLNSPIHEAGGKAGDVIKKINGTAIKNGKELYKYIEKNPFDGSDIQLVIERKGEEIELNVAPVVTTTYDWGFGVTSDRDGDGEADGPDGVVEALKYSYINVKTKVVVVFESLKMLITGVAGVEDMEGPVGIVADMGESLNTATSENPLREKISMILFWIVFLSTNLGVMNLLPLPALDGGRLAIHFVELIMRRPVNRTFEGVFHFVGFCVLMILMVILVFKDVLSLF